MAYLRMICDVETHVLTVTDVAVFDGGTRSLAAHTHSRSHCAHTHTHTHEVLNSDRWAAATEETLRFPKEERN